MPTSNHQRQQRRAAARRAAVATDDVPDAVPRPKGRGPRNHFWDPRPPGVRRHNESNEPNQRRAARLATTVGRGRRRRGGRGRRWSRINAARCNEAKSFQAPASSASWRGLHPAGAAHHAQAYAEEPVAPVAHELVARIDRAVQLSHALPTIKFDTTNIRPQKRRCAGRRATSEPTC